MGVYHGVGRKGNREQWRRTVNDAVNPRNKEYYGEREREREINSRFLESSTLRCVRRPHSQRRHLANKCMKKYSLKINMKEDIGL